MPNRRTVVIPVKAREIGPEDILIRAFANRQTFGNIQVVPDEFIQITKITNVNQLGNISVGPAGVDIQITKITNLSILGVIEVSEAPPDAVIRITKITNASVMGVIEVEEAPPDEFIYITKITNVSVMGNISVEFIASGAETPEGITSGMVTETVI